MLKTILLVAIGSAIGGVVRYLMQQFVQRRVESVFPYGTLYVNLLACLIIGIITGLADKGNILSPQTRIFLSVGICGGFSTFSSFINESHSMLHDGEILNSFIYVGISLFIGLIATAGGIYLVKSI